MTWPIMHLTTACDTNPTRSRPYKAVPHLNTPAGSAGLPKTSYVSSEKKSLPLLSITMNAGKFSTSIFHTASIPSSGNSSTSTCYNKARVQEAMSIQPQVARAAVVLQVTNVARSPAQLTRPEPSTKRNRTFLMQFFARMAAGPPMDPR